MQDACLHITSDLKNASQDENDAKKLKKL